MAARPGPWSGRFTTSAGFERRTRLQVLQNRSDLGPAEVRQFVQQVYLDRGRVAGGHTNGHKPLAAVRAGGAYAGGDAVADVARLVGQIAAGFFTAGWRQQQTDAHANAQAE
jgi:hypothetical protein